ncbi:uncharacterized protein LOC144887337 [Branchiostoma floridae x Branchiostoma japonicum]
MGDLKEELTCPVCLELFTCPIQLPCHHNICRRCAEDVLHPETDSSRDDGEVAALSAAGAPSPEDTPDTFPCPICHEEVSLDGRGLDGLRKDLLLQHIVDRYVAQKNKDEKIPCQLCKRSAKMAAKSCLECKVSYCEQCLAVTHPNHEPFTEHELVDPRTSFDEDQHVMCLDHPTKPVELYCVQDQTPVCTICSILGRHKEHSMAALEEVFSQKQAELQSLVDHQEAWLRQGEETVGNLEEKRENVETRAAQLKPQINEECDGLHRIICGRSTEMSHQVELARQGDAAKLEEAKGTAEGAVHKVRSSLAYAREALEETDPASFLLTEAAVAAKLGSSRSMLGTAMSVEHSCEVDDITIDFSKTGIEEMLESLDIGEPPEAPTIHSQECSTSLEEAYIIWQPVDEADEYEIRYKVDGVNLTATVRGRSFTAKQLNPGTKYTFRVRSRNDKGTSAETSIRLVTAAPPMAPTILGMNCSTTTEEACVVWEPVDDAWAYEVQYKVGDILMSTKVKSNTFTAKQLAPGTKYTFRIRSMNDNGTSAEASIQLVTTAPPAAPMILGMNCSTTTDEACLEWAPVEDAIAYEVLYKVDDVLISTKVNSNIFTAKQLTPGTKYTFGIRSMNDNGASAEAGIDLVTTAPPAAPMILHANCSTTTACIVWALVADASAYEVLYTVGDALMSAKVESNTFTAKQLTPGTKYTFEVRSMKYNVTSAEVSIVELVTAVPPAAPMILGMNCSTTTEEACVVWAPVADAIAYEVLYKVNDILMSTKVKSNTFTAKKLTPETMYSFNVKSISDIATSTASTIQLITKGPIKFRLDPNTIDICYLQLSTGNDCVKVYKTGHLVNAFLGDAPVTNGRQYWEVSVDSISYSVGVAYGDMPRDKDIRLTSKSWAFDRHGTSYYIQHDCKVVDYYEKYVKHPTKIGVLVDHGLGELSFYDADKRSLIFHHKTNGFKQPLYPAFSLWHGSISVHTGIICPY